MILLVMALLVLYIVGLTATIYVQARTGHWHPQSSYGHDEEIGFALIWPLSVLVILLFYLFSLVMNAPGELGQQHRKGKK